jgi:alkylation response protein AidB-like acyl-CoA dehydrogenase
MRDSSSGKSTTGATFSNTGEDTGRIGYHLLTVFPEVCVRDYFGPGMRLYLERIVDWEGLLALRSGAPVDTESEVGAYRTILETTAALAESFQDRAREDWAAEAELTPDGGAQSPPHIRDAYEKLREAGLMCLTVSEAYGGYGLPALLNGMFLEMISRADPSLMMVVGLQTGAANDIERYGSDAVKQAYLPRFVSGEVQGCMDLTEPQAGSDLGGIATRATDQSNGTVQIDGQKIFISNGGAEVHLVLARDGDTYDDSRGTTNGLSLVLVPRHRDGKPNGVRVTRLERKLGIHGSATCEVLFEGAIGERLGEKGQGFRAMLELMNAARLGVASQALGLSEAALQEAVAYARQRKQFDKPIAEQPLVMTMLAKMAVNTEAVRALLYRTYGLLDRNIARGEALARGDLSDGERSAVQEEYERDTVRVRLLTPLCKYFSTEICDDVTRDAIQVFGGLGFTLDSDVGKFHADNLIMTIYEGTSEIQASFALKEMGKGALAVVLDEVRSQLSEMSGDPTRADLVKLVEEAIGHVDEASTTLFADPPYALLRAKLMAEMVIDVIAACELLVQVGADASRLDLATSWIRKRMLVSENSARRIHENHQGRLERDARVLAAVAPSAS